VIPFPIYVSSCLSVCWLQTGVVLPVCMYINGLRSFVRSFVLSFFRPHRYDALPLHTRTMTWVIFRISYTANEIVAPLIGLHRAGLWRNAAMACIVWSPIRVSTSNCWRIGTVTNHRSLHAWYIMASTWIGDHQERPSADAVYRSRTIWMYEALEVTFNDISNKLVTLLNISLVLWLYNIPILLMRLKYALILSIFMKV